ncbi:MAG: ATP-binding cassette domain-containing protein, partial [Kiritimatiellales bacterium]
MKSAIQIKNLALELNGSPILQAVSFDIDQGEYVSIIGPNGAGKTTLFRCLLGMYPYKGSAKTILNSPVFMILPENHSA